MAGLSIGAAAVREMPSQRSISLGSVSMQPSVWAMVDLPARACVASLVSKEGGGWRHASLGRGKGLCCCCCCCAKSVCERAFGRRGKKTCSTRKAHGTTLFFLFFFFRPRGRRRRFGFLGGGGPSRKTDRVVLAIGLCARRWRCHAQTTFLPTDREAPYVFFLTGAPAYTCESPPARLKVQSPWFGKRVDCREKKKHENRLGNRKQHDR